MNEHTFHLLIWGAAVQMLRAMGIYWRLCNDIKIVRDTNGAKSVIITVRDDDSIATAAVYNKES